MKALEVRKVFKVGTGKSKDKESHQLGFPIIPDKMFFKISDVSQLAGIEAHVLRYWESEFSELKPRKTESGRRQYTRKDIDVILEIKSLLYDDGFSIAGAKKRLQKRKKTSSQEDAIIEAVRQTKKGLEEILGILNGN